MSAVQIPQVRRFALWAVLVRDALGAFFIATSLLKAASPKAALASIAMLFGPEHARVVLGGLLLCEWGLGVLLLAHVWPRRVAGSAAGFLAVSIVSLLTLRARGYSDSCGCLGSLIPTSLTFSLALSGALSVACASLLLVRHLPCLPPVDGRN